MSPQSRDSDGRRNFSLAKFSLARKLGPSGGGFVRSAVWIMSRAPTDFGLGAEVCNGFTKWRLK